MTQQQMQQQARVRRQQQQGGIIDDSSGDGERRLQEMQAGAEQLERMRDERAAVAVAAKARGDGDGEQQQGGASFLSDMQKEVYRASAGSGGGNDTLAGRVAQNRHYNQKGAALDDGSGFTKPR
jgi:hypothetical protein